MYYTPEADPYMIVALHYTKNTLRVWMWRLLVNLLVSGIGFATFLGLLRWIPELLGLPDFGFFDFKHIVEALQWISPIAAVAGATSGLLHWLLLTRRIKGALMWCVSYWLTWTVGFIVFWFLGRLLIEDASLRDIIILILIPVILTTGIIAGTTQWYILRRHIPYPRRWILTNISGQLGIWMLLLVSILASIS